MAAPCRYCPRPAVYEGEGETVCENCVHDDAVGEYRQILDLDQAPEPSPEYLRELSKAPSRHPAWMLREALRGAANLIEHLDGETRSVSVGIASALPKPLGRGEAPATQKEKE